MVFKGNTTGSYPVGFDTQFTVGTLSVYNIATENFGSYGSRTFRQWRFDAAEERFQAKHPSAISADYVTEGKGEDPSPLEQIQGDGILVTLKGPGGNFPIGFWNAGINPPHGSWMAFQAKSGEADACRRTNATVMKKGFFGGEKEVPFEHTCETLDDFHRDNMRGTASQNSFINLWNFIQNAARGGVDGGRL